MMIDAGHGTPIVLVPGVQGRWEWMAPTVDALADRGRVVSYSLCGESGEREIEPELGFESFITQLDDVLDRAELDTAHLGGVSYGGLIALRYAARRPGRVRSLTLVSTPSPSWRPECRIERYLRAPRLMAPAFVAGSPFRLWPEIYAAFDGWGTRLGFTVHHLMRVAAAPFSSVRMAERVRLMSGIDFLADCHRVTAPTLVVTGEPSLDQIVPVESTLEFVEAIAGAKAATLARTGHIGFASRPAAFANLLASFAEAHADERMRIENLLSDWKGTP